LTDGTTDGESRGANVYRRAGVDLEAGHRAVELIRDLAGRASRPEVAGGIGGFAGLFDLGDGRLLAAATDGVGTKLEVARLAGRLDTVGIDCVAMSANDVACTGAEPLLFLDYVAVGRLVPEEVAAVVSGVAEGCRRAGCALLGGETAEHPGILEEGRFDLVGFCVGLVDRDRLLSPDRVQAGDTLIGLPSLGLHSNGFSLIRRTLLEGEGARRLDEPAPGLGRPLGDELLEPTAIYVHPLLSLGKAGLLRSAAHISGGGWHENVPRALPPGLGAVVDTSAWSPPPIFGLVAEAAGVGVDELFGVLNMGIGLVAIVARGMEELALGECRTAGTAAVVVGSVVEGDGVVLK
jgi:phosphoribosylformylglycinamidine cyclo-ligase